MSDREFIYLDNHSTTRCDPRVVQAMLPFLESEYGNPASVTHAAGQRAEQFVERHRARIAELIGANRPAEIVFTSGATESNNLAITGFCRRNISGHIVSVSTEHPSVIAPLERARKEGWSISFLPVAQAGQPDAGRIDLQHFRDAIQPGTSLVSVMMANNEIGVLLPIREIADICRRHNLVLHCDATQAIGKIPVSVNELDVDLMSFSAHKIYGPKGIGALYVRSTGRRVRLEPVSTGGGQEQGRRGGTLNVPGIVGLGTALEIAMAGLNDEAARLAELREQLFQELSAGVPGLVLNGPDLSSGMRLPNNLNCQLPGVDGHSLMIQCHDIALSSGSACTATSSEPSHVLRALGLSSDQIRCSLRFGLGRFNTADEMVRAGEILVESYRRLRKLG